MSDDEQQSNYLKYRGKCKEMSEAACAADPSLRLVRGHYYCPIWHSNEQHWWCEKPDGTIVDPTKLQFPSEGKGFYTEFDGIIQCAECGKEVKEEDARIDGNYAFCSSACNARFVGM